MPTPFTHLAYASRLLAAADVPAGVRAALDAERAAFLLGSTVADARVDDHGRDYTHFYTYEGGVAEPPWQVMLAQFPALLTPTSPAQRALVAAYVFHLAMDAVWTTDMLGPHFALAHWGASRRERFVMLHALLSHMDARDRATLGPAEQQAYATAQPDGWLPFMPDGAMCAWRDLMLAQLPPDGTSQTLAIFAPRIGLATDEMAALVADDAMLEGALWAHVPRSTLAHIEAAMMTTARAALLAYWDASG